MDAVILEVLRRDGRVSGRHRIEGHRLRVGRAYDNDIILDDPYVCPYHAELDRDDEGVWRVRDLASVNGVWHRPSGWLGDAKQLDSGDELTLGHSRLRLVHADHEVAATRRDVPRPSWVALLNRPVVASLSVVASAVFVSYLGLLASGSSMGWAQRLTPAVGVLLLIAGWSACWSGIGYLAQRRTALAGHCSVAALGLLASNGLSQITDFTAFWSGHWLLTEGLAYLGATLIGAGVLYGGLLLATRIRWGRALLASHGVAWSLLVAFVVADIANEPDFSGRPDYAQELKPPTFAWMPTSRPETFARTMDEVFDELDQRVEESDATGESD